MKVKVTEQGLLIPKQLLQGVQEVEIRRYQGALLIVPLAKNDPILELGKEPIIEGVQDASINHDYYL